MKRSIFIILNIGFWFCYIILNMALVGLYLEGQSHEEYGSIDVFTKVLFFSFIPSIISFYSFYFFIFPFFKKRKFLQAFVYAITISIGSALLGTALMAIFLGVESLSNGQESATVGVVFVSFVNLAVGIIALITNGFINWLEELKLKEELQQKNHAMEMALVKSQLDPHFLFNTLNNIDILILKDAEEASNYLNKLSDIMRFMLFETKADEIFLSKELEYIEKYISLQKIRTANTDYVSYTVTGSPNNRMIAPMAFLPFIENAFKHCTNKKLENAIYIHIMINDDTIELICKNKYNPNRIVKQENNGLGNALIERRLQLIYPDKHNLKILKNEAMQYCVRLVISD